MPKDFDSASLYDFALQQMVAEAYLDGLTNFAPNNDDLITRLALGNNASGSNGYSPTRIATEDKLPGATRLTDSQARDFLDRFEIIDHHANDTTGFSATLIRRRGTDEYTFAMRSTEFALRTAGGDRDRDIGSGVIPLNPPGTDMEIARYGFALAQLAAMEEYYQQLRDQGKLPGSATLDVAAYSLSGHLATVFTERHADEIRRTYVANGAGRGSISAAEMTPETLIEIYKQIVADPDAGTAALADWYLGRGLQSLAVGVALTRVGSEFAAARAAPAISWRTDGTWQAGSIYTSPRHRFAMSVLDPLLDGALWNSLFTGTQIAPDVNRKITYLVGIGTHDDDTATANSGVTPAEKNWLFIEDQPNFYGDGGFLPGWLVDMISRVGVTYQPGDFTRTHSITLIADSLALMNVFSEADADLTKLDIETIFAAASNQRAVGNVWFTYDPRKSSAEANSLESALYALRKALAPAPAAVNRLVPDDTAEDFGHLSNRQAFYEEIASVRESINGLRDPISGVSPIRITPLMGMDWVPIQNKVFRATGIGAYTVRAKPGQSPLSLADEASGEDAEGIALRYALRELNPFAITGISYAEHNRDGSLDLFDSETGLGMTREYLESRVELLVKLLERSIDDTGFARALDTTNVLYEDRSRHDATVATFIRPDVVESNLRSELSGQSSGRRDALFVKRAREMIKAGVAALVSFSSELGDQATGGAEKDRLFGGIGGDVLVGMGGDDRLEGGAGSDWLDGGSGVDVLLGGAGDDQLAGGRNDNDILEGGLGEDTYVINSGDGTDTIRDTGRNYIKWNGRVVGGLFEKSGSSESYRLISSDPALRELTLTFNSPATLSDGTGAALVLENYETPEAFDEGDFGITFFEESLDPVTTRTTVGDDRDGNVFELGPENDRIEARGGTDEVYADGGNDYVDAGDGDDWVVGDSQDYEFVPQLIGDDLLIGGAGADTLIDYTGNDRLYGDRRVDLVETLADQSTAADPSAGDWLAAGKGDDLLVGGATSDVLTGGGGKDVLVGGAGGDFLMGDADYRPVRSGWNAGRGSTWQFSVRSDGRPSEFASAPAEMTDPPSSAADVIYGGTGDDWAWAGLGDDLIYGGEGKDLLFGNSGSDVIDGGDGDDLLAAGGRKGIDLADLGDDYLSGGAGNDTLYGSAGDTFLFGDDGDDLISAGPGSDFIDGGAGNDRISAQGADVAYGGEGDDLITSFGTQTVALYGGEGADLLRSDQGEDALFGGDGDDVLNGDEGRDFLDGGAGNDRYFLAPWSGVDELYDESGEDVVEIQSIENATPELAVSRDSILLVDDDSGGVSLAFGILGDRVELGPDPLGVIERVELWHYVGSIITTEVIDLAELWEAYLGPTVQTNSAPGLAQPLLDATATEDEVFTYALSSEAFFDPDPDDLLSYSASSAGGGALPAWLGFDPATQTFSGLPTNAAVGIVEVSVTATDLAGASASASFLISVANANDAPLVAGSIAPQAVEEESLFQLALPSNLFADEDAGDTLVWSAGLANGESLPGWLAFDPDTKTLRGTPTRADVGTLSVAVSARDDAEATASLAFDLAVTKAPGQTLAGGAGSEVIQGGPGDDTLLGGAGADAMIGGKGDDTFVLASDGAWSAGYAAYNAGSPGNPGTGRIVAIQGKARLFDTLDGGEGLDTVQGTAGPDAVFLDDGLSPFPGAAGSRLTGVERFLMGAGNDTVDLTSFDYALGAVRIEGEDGDDLLWASAGDDTLLGGLGRDELYGGAGADYLAGGAGDDSLDGAYGTDALQGGEGNDTLLDTSGGALLDGGAGNDALNGGAAAELFVGGKGSDSLRPGGGNDVVLVNRGDGADRIAPGAGAKALSLGGGIAYEELALERTANHLVVHLGNGETVELTDWYASAANQGFRTMQVIAEAMAGFDAGGADPLRDNAVERFDFQGLVAAFDAARAADSMITRWQAMHALLDAHLGGSDDEALGGEPVYRYGMTGTLAGQSIAAVQAAIESPDFGSKPQAIAPSADARGAPLLG